MASNPTSLSFVQGSTARYSISIRQDTNLLPVDLTGCTFSGDIRQEYGAPVLTSWNVTPTDLENGRFEIYLTNLQTAALPVSGFRTSFVFDVDIHFPNGDVKTYLYGYLKVTREVTT